MKRWHLFELGDSSWLPNCFRIYLTNILAYQAGIVYRFALPKLIETLKYTHSRNILDLCSGSGGPWPVLLPLLNKYAPYPISVTLSDKHPPQSNKPEWLKTSFLSYHPQPIDVRSIPDDLPAFRTIFTGFHHLKPHEAKSVLMQASNDKHPIAIFEFTERKMSRIKEMFLSPSLVFQITRQLPQLSIGQRFWTYVLPIIPFLYFWDGSVSNLRSYTFEELKTMTASIQSIDYKWECGLIELPNTSNKITFLIGLPIKKTTQIFTSTSSVTSHQRSLNQSENQK